MILFVFKVLFFPPLIATTILHISSIIDSSLLKSAQNSIGLESSKTLFLYSTMTIPYGNI
jgi:hypothetical protein